MSLQTARSGARIFSFPALSKTTFLGLPGLLADTLPDKFGNAVIDAWLARNGRTGTDFSPVERLCYTGQRGMGALEYQPALVRKCDKSVPIDIANLVELAQDIMRERTRLDVHLGVIVLFVQIDTLCIRKSRRNMVMRFWFSERRSFPASG